MAKYSDSYSECTKIKKFAKKVDKMSIQLSPSYEVRTQTHYWVKKIKRILMFLPESSLSVFVIKVVKGENKARALSMSFYRCSQ